MLDVSITISLITPNLDVPDTYRILGTVKNGENNNGEFLASYVDATTAGLFTAGNTYTGSIQTDG